MVDHPELIERIAEWLWSEWAYVDPARTPASWAEDLRQRRSRDAIPTTFVALAGGELLGSVTLMAYDLETRRDLSPWMGELFVAPAARGQGVGSALVRHAVRAAAAMGIDHLYLQTSTAQELYERLGWRTIAYEGSQGERVVVMTIDPSSSV